MNGMKSKIVNKNIVIFDLDGTLANIQKRKDLSLKANGKIDYNECFYCLDCQEEYFDDHRCPPLVNRRKIFMEKNYVN